MSLSMTTLVSASIIALAKRTVEHIAVGHSAEITTRSMKAIYHQLASNDPTLPPNHDIYRAFVAACRRSLIYLLDRYSSRPSYSADKASLLALVTLIYNRKAMDISDDLVDRLPSLLSDDTPSDSAHTIDVAPLFERSLISWMTRHSTKPLPAWFEKTFSRGATVDGMELRPWRQVFHAFFCEEFKDNERVFRALTVDMLQAITLATDTIRDRIAADQSRAHVRDMLMAKASVEITDFSVLAPDRDFNAAQLQGADIASFSSTTPFKLRLRTPVDGRHVCIIQSAPSTLTFTGLAYDLTTRRTRYRQPLTPGTHHTFPSTKAYTEQEPGRHTFYALIATNASMDDFPSALAHCLQFSPKLGNYELTPCELRDVIDTMTNHDRDLQVFATECVVT